MSSNEKKGLNISVKSFITAIIVIFILMVISYILTLVIPGGVYGRIADENGNMIIDTASGYSAVTGGIAFWKWLLSPILVLGSSGSGTLIAVIIFLLVIGGVFNSLEACGMMKYILSKTANRFQHVRYKLMAVVVFFFMAMGSAIGSFEECVPLVPLVCALSVSLGWDVLTGVAMSLLAAGCGFAAGVCNPFTVGVAQQLAGLPMFSGIWLRLVAFALIYELLLLFIYLYAKKIQKPLAATENQILFQNEPQKDKAMTCFISILGVGIAFVILSALFPALQDYTMIIVAVMFLAAGTVTSLVSGMSGKEYMGGFVKGVINIFPAVLMILMASSIKYTLEEAKVLDTILYGAVSVAQSLPKWSVILFIYLIVLIMNFFIPSGSAKAFMLIPLIVPMAQVFGISAQLCVVAFAFGDGFSNVFYPTNPALLISLGLADVSYSKWFRWSVKFQILNMLLTSGILLLGLAVGY